MKTKNADFKYKNYMVTIGYLFFYHMGFNPNTSSYKSLNIKTKFFLQILIVLTNYPGNNM